MDRGNRVEVHFFWGGSVEMGLIVRLRDILIHLFISPYFK